jgi:hypothetical protein
MKVDQFVTATGISCLFALSVPLLRPARADTLITFETLAPGTAVSNQYLPQGVEFNGVPGIIGAGAHISSGAVTGHNSSNNVLINSPLADEFTGGPLTVNFTTPQQTVTLWGGFVLFNNSATSLQGTLTAFDQTGTPIPGAVAGPVVVIGGAANTQFTVTSTMPNIWSVTLNLGLVTFTVIDDLEFSGGAPITPPASGPPVVSIGAPGSSVDATNSALQVSGTVSGQELLPTVQVALQAQFSVPGQPPTSLITTLALDSTQSLFSGATFSNLPIGPYLLTVTATNVAGQTGSASVKFANLPASLNDPTDILQLQYSVPAGNCQFIAFNDGAKPTDPTNRVWAYFPNTGQILTVDAPVFQKWLQVDDYTILRNDGRLGCPLQEGTSYSLSQSPIIYEIQPFERGSIYWAPLGGSPPVNLLYYTPKVFADAIETLSVSDDNPNPPPPTGGSAANSTFQNDYGGLNEVGFPTGDPISEYSSENPTYLFQRFARPWYLDANNNPGAANTLEIRGRTPTLFVERIGGDLVDYSAAIGGSAGALPQVGDLTPTIWQNYGCLFDSGLQQYKCSVSRPHIQAVTAETGTPMYSTGIEVPNYGDYCFSDNSIILSLIALQSETEWSAIPGKSSPNSNAGTSSDAIPILTMGWVRQSQPSNADFPATHRHLQGSAAGTQEEGLWGCVGGIVGCAIGGFVAHEFGGMGNGVWSDWDLHIRPLVLSIADPNAPWVLTPAAGNLPPFWNLLAANGDPTLEGSPTTPPTPFHPPPGDMEIEWEAFWQNTWTAIPGNTTIQPKSLAIIDGRWIIDCGHPPQHSEIHPPNSVFAITSTTPPKSTKPPKAGAADSFSTVAQVWINQLYQGSPYQTQIWPPPRPSPTAEVLANYLAFGEPSGGIVANGNNSYTFYLSPTFTDTHVPNISAATVSLAPNGVSVSVSGPTNSHQVNDTGQVVFPSDNLSSSSGPVGTLMARWYVGWLDE